MQNQCNLNVRSKCILNALRIRKGSAKNDNLEPGLEARSENCLALSFAAPLVKKLSLYKIEIICNQKTHIAYTKSW